MCLRVRRHSDLLRGMAIWSASGFRAAFDCPCLYLRPLLCQITNRSALP
jgi:hypothetical protein